MLTACVHAKARYTEAMDGAEKLTSTDRADAEMSSKPLYFFPEDEVSATDLREMLDEGSRSERAWAISHLLRFAQWEDIWTYVTRDDVREIFPDLELPETLAAAWARMLKIEATVG